MACWKLRWYYKTGTMMDQFSDGTTKLVLFQLFIMGLLMCVAYRFGYHCALCLRLRSLASTITEHTTSCAWTHAKRRSAEVTTPWVTSSLLCDLRVRARPRARTCAPPRPRAPPRPLRTVYTPTTNLVHSRGLLGIIVPIRAGFPFGLFTASSKITFCYRTRVS